MAAFGLTDGVAGWQRYEIDVVDSRLIVVGVFVILYDVNLGIYHLSIDRKLA